MRMLGAAFGSPRGGGRLIKLLYVYLIKCAHAWEHALPLCRGDV